VTGPVPGTGTGGDRPPVSVVVPVRDRRALLVGLLDALAVQSFAGAELIVVDDGSTDGSARAAEGRPGVRVLRTPGVGAVAARRIGVQAARAPVLAFTDSDCVPEPAWLAAGMEAIAAGADLVQGATYPIRAVRPRERSVAVGREDGLYATCNLFCRREAFERAGGFDEDAGRRLGFRPGRVLGGTGFGEDTLLGWAVRRAGRAVFEPRAVVRHHVFPPSPADTARRAYAVGAFPALVREVPELRRTLLVDGVFLGSRSRLPLYAAALLALGRRVRLAGAVATGWALWRAAAVLAAEPSNRRRLAVVPLELASELATAASLVAGSARARSVVL